MDTINLNNNTSSLERAIVGALKCSIHEHGPITRAWTGSTAKRVIGAIKQYNQNIINEDRIFIYLTS